MKRNTLAYGLLTGILTLIPAIPVAAGRSAYDQSELILGLANQGMAELLDRLSDVAEADPVVDAQMRVARLRIDASDTSLDPSERAAAVNAAIDALAELIRENPEHDLTPVWKTTLGELILVDLFQAALQNAAEFYEFGVPTDVQRSAVERSTVRALRELSDAARRFDRIRDERGRQDPGSDDRLDDRVWQRMSRDYAESKTPYLLAHAAYYTALLSDRHTYYQNLGDPSFPGQRREPNQERDRLTGVAVERSKPFVDDAGNAVAFAAKCLMARGMFRQSGGDAQRAMVMLESLKGERFYGFLASLARAVHMYDTGDPRGAQAELARLAEDPGIKANLFFRLLIVDQLHLQKLAEAQRQPDTQRPQAVSEAYGVYDQLINDRSLGEQAAGIKGYIYRRWESQLAQSESEGASLAELPVPVMRAVAEMSRVAGQNLMIEADEADQISQTARAAELRTQAEPKLDRAIELCRRVLGMQSVDRPAQADLMYNLGMALYFKADGDVQGQLNATDVWRQLAQDLPELPQAEEGIEIAISVLQQLHAHTPRPDGVDEAYRATAEALFEKFPTSRAADNERIYYAFAVLVPSGEYHRAADLLGKIPREHEHYFPAKREQLFSLKEMMRHATKPQDRRIAEERLEQTANELIREASSVAHGPQAESARNAAGWAKLMLVELAIEQGRTEQAVSQLEGFDREYGDDEDLLRESLAKGIVALAQAGDYDQVLSRAKAMMQQFPDDAAAVIDGVLADLDARIDQLRQSAAESLVERDKNQMLDQAMALARTTEGLSQMLLEWAMAQGYSEDDLVAFKLLLAKGRRLAGKPDGAAMLLEPLAEKYAEHPGVIHQVAEALYAKSRLPEEQGGAVDRDAIVAAASQFDRLIIGLEGQEDDELKRIWWNAWMRRLQISDVLGEGVGDIPLRVRQLRQTADPNLGGEPFRTILTKLEVKHGTR